MRTVPAGTYAIGISTFVLSQNIWYVRHRYQYLRVEPEYATDDLPLFQHDASYILHPESFYSGYYSLESFSFRGWYIRMQDNGFLWIEYFASSFIDTASFTLRKCYCFIGEGGIVLSD